MIETVVQQQQHAYALLLWLDERARRNPTILSREVEIALGRPQTCEEWLQAAWCHLPSRFLPRRDRSAPFAALLSSFFQVSFHIDRLEWQGRPVEARLVLGPRAPAKRTAKRGRHGGNVFDETLHHLCGDAGITADRSVLRRLRRAQTLTQDLLVWTWARGLVERAHGRAEGIQTWRIWRRIAPQTRRVLDANAVWVARSRLVERLCRMTS